MNGELITKIEILNTQMRTCSAEFKEGWDILMNYKERLHLLSRIPGKENEIRALQCSVDSMVKTLTRKMLYMHDCMSKIEVCIEHLRHSMEKQYE